MHTRLRFFAVLFASLLIAWIFIRTVKDSLLDLTRIANESMLPYLTPGQTVLISKTSPCLKLPFLKLSFACTACEPGRAYVFRDPRNAKHRLVKFAVSAPVLTGAATGSGTRDIIWFTQSLGAALTPLDRYRACYFEGSNRAHSVDSRQFGPVPLENIEGKIIYPAIRMARPPVASSPPGRIEL
jgi:hypothetical protein